MESRGVVDYRPFIYDSELINLLIVEQETFSVSNELEKVENKKRIAEYLKRIGKRLAQSGVHNSTLKRNGLTVNLSRGFQHPAFTDQLPPLNNQMRSRNICKAQQIFGPDSPQNSSS